jgi:hypothetical protein
MTGDQAMAAAQTHALLASAYCAIAAEKVHADIQIGGNP